MTPKIATCCYCGARAALVLGRDRHELACSGCGAPLRALKSVPAAAAKVPEARRAPKLTKRRKKTKRKDLKTRLFEKAWDLIEDALD